jgi:RimJ/RimL family protein N-acetyltransferase
MTVQPQIEVRPFESREDHLGMIDYYLDGSEEFLRGMGIDPQKLPPRDFWFEHVWRDRLVPETDPGRDRFYLAWLLDGEQVGHSSINEIHWGSHACAHLHLWRPDLRRGGLGAEFFRRSISLYFERFDLKTIIVEPYAENPAPNRVLQKLGFTFVRRYRTTPGPVAFEQELHRYEVTREEWQRLMETG